MSEMTECLRGLTRVRHAKRLSAIVLLLGVVVVFGVGVAGAAPLGQVTEFSSGLNAGSQPTGIAAGPDGNLWFVDPGITPAIGRITPSGAITEFSSGLPVGSLPGGVGPPTATAGAAVSNNGIAAGPDGNLWFSDDATPAAIGRITPSGAITEFSSGLNAGSSPRNLSAGPDGNVWFTDPGSGASPTPAIGLICLTGSPSCSAGDVASHAIHEISLPTTPKLSVPGVIAAGPDGNLWFSDRATPSAPRIGRITPAGTITEFSLPTTSVPGSLAAGPDGNLWFTDRVLTGSLIGRITPSGTITEFSSGLTATSSLFSIAEGPDGNLWFTDVAVPSGGAAGTSAPAIGMVDPTTGASTEFDLPVGRGPFGITAGPDGNVWFADRSATSVTGVTTTAGTPGTAKLATGTFPASLVAGTPLSGPGIPIGATVLSGAGTNTLSLSAVTTASTNAVLIFRPSPAIGRFGLGVCGNSLQGCNLQGVNLQNIILNGANLQGSNLQNAQLENAHLIGANLQGDNLQGAQFQNYAFLDYANLQGDNLQNADLAGADLTGAILRGSNLHGANLTGVNLTGANLTGANLQGGNLTGANLTGATLTGANLQGVNLTNANLTGADLRGANLQGANLTGANLTNTDFTGANLGGQRFLRRIAVIGLPAPYAVPASFDIGFVDPATQGYYLADHTNAGVDAINGSSDSFGSVIGAGLFSLGGNAESPAQILACGRGNAGPNGVLSLSVGGVNQLWASDGVSAANSVSNVKVFTLSTPTSGTLAATISTAVTANGTNGTCRADEIAYDPKQQLVLLANDRAPDKYVSLISANANPTSDAVVAQIKFPEAVNGIEQPVWDPEMGVFYINIPGVEVAVIDPVTLSVKTTYPTPGCSASGLALDERTQQLLLSCSVNPNGVAFMDARTGAISAHFPQVSGADEVWFDPGMRDFYLAASSMTSTGQVGGTATPVLGVISAGQAASGAQAQWLVNVPTGTGAHSVAADAVNGQVFLPIAGLGGIAVYAWTTP